MKRSRSSLLVLPFVCASLACSSGGSPAPPFAPYQEEEEEPEFDEPDDETVLRILPRASALRRGTIAAGPQSAAERPPRPSFAWAFYVTAREGHESDRRPRLLLASHRAAVSRAEGTARA